MVPLWTQWLSLSFLQFYPHFRTLDLQETLETLNLIASIWSKQHAWGHVLGASPQTVQVSLLLPQYFPWKADKYFYCVQVPSQSAVDPCLFFCVTSLLRSMTDMSLAPLHSSLTSVLLAFLPIWYTMDSEDLPLFISVVLLMLPWDNFILRKLEPFWVSGPCFETMFR